jgi:apolipoprotein N-acyltransferase
LALVSGVLLALSLPPFDVEWLGWVALAPLFLAVRDLRGREGAGPGLLAGLLCGAIHVRRLPGGTPESFAYLPFLCLALMLAAVGLAAGWAARRWEGPPWVLFVACAGIAGEWVTTFGPLPLHLALCQYRQVPLLGLASLTGIWGISFLLWWTNAAAAELLARGGSPRRLAAGTAVLAAAVLAWDALGLQGDRPGPPLRVAAIQDYTPGEAGREEEAAGEGPDREALTRRAAAEGAELIVWSELGLGSAFSADDPGDSTRSLARELRTCLVAGYSESGTPRGHNCAALIGPDGAVLGVHRKIHLFLGERRDTDPGRETRVFASALGTVGMEICFDTCYTGVTRRMAAGGARLIAMPNFDPPTPNGVLHRLHAAMLPFRAAENRLPFVRADPTGLSQVIDRDGRIAAQSPLWRPDALVADITPGDSRGTPFTRLGDWLAYVCLLLLGGFVCRALARRDPIAPAAPGSRERFRPP